MSATSAGVTHAGVPGGSAGNAPPDGDVRLDGDVRAGLAMRVARFRRAAARYEVRIAQASHHARGVWQLGHMVVTFEN